MARGRKPKNNAIRRGGTQPTLSTTERAEVVALQKPVMVALNPTMDACWELIVGASPNFAPADVPQLEAYCYWYAVLQQCIQQTITEDGRVVTVYAEHDEANNVKPLTAKRNPDLLTAEKATAMLRQLGAELNLSPVARARAGLMDAMTRSTQADVVNKTVDAFAKFKEAQDAAK